MLSPNKDKKEKKEEESAITRLTQTFEELEEKKEISGSGELGGFDTKVEYGYSIKLGPEPKDIMIRSDRDSHFRKKEKVK